MQLMLYLYCLRDKFKFLKLILKQQQQNNPASNRIQLLHAIGLVCELPVSITGLPLHPAHAGDRLSVSIPTFLNRMSSSAGDSPEVRPAGPGKAKRK